MKSSHLPEWQLPAGVTRGLWDYCHADHIADDYDGYFAENRLFAYDAALIDEHFRRPGRVVDLGCGTARLLLPLAARGFDAVAVDLSLPMLRVAGEKAARAGVRLNRVQANFVELGCFADASIDYCILMFNTLGMVHGSENRRRVLHHVRRMLRPGGLFVLHVHNRWHSLFDPQGRRWLLCSSLRPQRGLESGDKVFEYRGIPQVCLHVFALRELRGLLRESGFAIRKLVAQMSSISDRSVGPGGSAAFVPTARSPSANDVSSASSECQNQSLQRWSGLRRDA